MSHRMHVQVHWRLQFAKGSKDELFVIKCGYRTFPFVIYFSFTFGLTNFFIWYSGSFQCPVYENNTISLCWIVISMERLLAVHSPLILWGWACLMVNLPAVKHSLKGNFSLDSRRRKVTVASLVQLPLLKPDGRSVVIVFCLYTNAVRVQAVYALITVILVMHAVY